MVDDLCQRTAVPVYRYLVGSADYVTVHGEGGYRHSTPSRVRLVINCRAIFCKFMQCAVRHSLVLYVTVSCYVFQSRVQSFRTRGVCSVRRPTLTSPSASTDSHRARQRLLGSQTHQRGTNISLCEWTSACVKHTGCCCQCGTGYG